LRLVLLLGNQRDENRCHDAVIYRLIHN
jgi:hypothetical protein